MTSHNPALEPGQLVRRRMLGTDATYRVVGQNARGVEVEVVEAPGLTPGDRFTFALEDVAVMRAIQEKTEPSSNG